jgi:GH15 family glucan-1,4-alpha-glucosidase
MRERYLAEDVTRLKRALDDHGTLRFVPLATGLFSASPLGGGSAQSGYDNVWVRDNVYVAYAHLVRGDVATAVGVARALLTFFQTYERKIVDVISGVTDPQNVANRPHVRFDGRTLREVSGEKWSHAQNDALGYFVWLVSKLVRQRAFQPGPADWRTLSLFTRYFQAIRYWQDADSGHWEEVRKVSASSIGTVLAGLRELSNAISARPSHEQRALHAEAPNLLEDLVELGTNTLRGILPHECAPTSSSQGRRYDAALTFLVHPLGVVDGEMAGTVLADIGRELSGEIGIRRYPGDSYWAPDYDSKLSPADRTRDFSDDIEARDRLLSRAGDEAQWCIFDGFLSAHHGVELARTRAPEAREKQAAHLNRALRQITPPDALVPDSCPELYYLREGRWIANPHAPLQWTQASLVVALEQMEKTASIQAA